MQPLISVIVPVYQVEAYLAVCLKSLAMQEGVEIEFILVDDGSTDGSLALCQQAAEQDRRFVVLHQQNGGVSSARNLGLMHARGRYIGFADGDDWLEPTMFGQLLAAVQQHEADVAMCGYYEYLQAPKAAPLIKGIEPISPCEAKEAARHILRRTGYFTSLWNKLFSREVIFREQGPVLFDEALSVGEDETWLLRVLPRIRRAAFVPVPLYHWRSRGDSASRRECITPRSMSVLRAKQQAEQLAQAIDPGLKQLTQSRLLNDCYHLKVIAYRQGDRQALRNVNQAFRCVRKSWLLSNDVLPLRKAKVLTMSLLIALHAPVKWVDRVYGLRRNHG